MKILIICCSPRIAVNSNSSILAEAFAKGCQNQSAETEICHLEKRGTWNEICQKIEQYDNVVFALPLYIDTVPSILLEFLEGLTPRKTRGNIAFIIASGFAEAFQSDCCKKYLLTLPEKYNFDYKGCLVKGSTFGVHFFPPDNPITAKSTTPFMEMGEVFGEKGEIPENLADAFSAPYRLNKKQVIMYKLLIPIQNLFMQKLSKQLGAKTKLMVKPLKEYVKK